MKLIDILEVIAMAICLAAIVIAAVYYT